MEISVLDWEANGRGAGDLGGWGSRGTGECFHFARAVGGTLRRAVTLFNKCLGKQGARSGGGGVGRETRWLGLAGDCHEMKVALRPFLSSLSAVSTF